MENQWIFAWTHLYHNILLKAGNNCYATLDLRLFLTTCLTAAVSIHTWSSFQVISKRGLPNILPLHRMDLQLFRLWSMFYHCSALKCSATKSVPHILLFLFLYYGSHWLEGTNFCILLGNTLIIEYYLQNQSNSKL